jgi:predicted permease
MLDTLVYELRVGFRRLARDPLRSGISVVALTLGIGLTASMFSIAYSVLFRATPFDGEDRLFRVERLHPETGRRVASMPFLDYRDLSEEQSTLSALGAFAGGGVDLADGDAPPERIRASRFSPSFLRLLQVSPRLGRGFGPDDIGPHARVALISDRLWRDRFGGDPGMVGRSVRLNGDSHTVIGVMEPGFHFPGNQDLWLPLPFDPTSVGRNQGFVQVMARLPENADENVARAELETILAQLTREFGEGAAPSRVVLVPLVQSFLGEDDVALLWAMMIGSLLVLAIACVNVTNLLTAVAADRTGDLAVCTVLGASRRRVVSQLLMDAALLSLTGGVLGVLVANGFVRWFDRVLIGRKPVWLVMEVDTPILLFTLGVSMLAAPRSAPGTGISRSTATTCSWRSSRCRPATFPPPRRVRRSSRSSSRGPRASQASGRWRSPMSFLRWASASGPSRSRASSTSEIRTTRGRDSPSSGPASSGRWACSHPSAARSTSGTGRARRPWSSTHRSSRATSPTPIRWGGGSGSAAKTSHGGPSWVSCRTFA